MESVVMGFSTTSASPISWAIKKVEGTEFSHVYIRVYSKSVDRWLVYHASRSDLHFTNWPTFQKENEILEEYELICSEEQKSEVLKFCIDRMGVPYGRLQLIGMGIVRLAKLWLKKEINNPFTDGAKTQVCSEFAGRVLKLLGMDIPEKALEVEGPKWIREQVLNYPHVVYLK